jgi:hypothetical protein
VTDEKRQTTDRIMGYLLSEASRFEDEARRRSVHPDLHKAPALLEADRALRAEFTALARAYRLAASAIDLKLHVLHRPPDKGKHQSEPDNIVLADERLPDTMSPS